MLKKYLLLPLVLGFVFMVTAWTYCVRGWLAALMVNKRRRRAIVEPILPDLRVGPTVRARMSPRSH